MKKIKNKKAILGFLVVALILGSAAAFALSNTLTTTTTLDSSLPVVLSFEDALNPTLIAGESDIVTIKATLQARAGDIEADWILEITAPEEEWDASTMVVVMWEGINVIEEIDGQFILAHSTILIDDFSDLYLWFTICFTYEAPSGSYNFAFFLDGTING